MFKSKVAAISIIILLTASFLMVPATAIAQGEDNNHNQEVQEEKTLAQGEDNNHNQEVQEENNIDNQEENEGNETETPQVEKVEENERPEDTEEIEVAPENEIEVPNSKQMEENEKSDIEVKETGENELQIETHNPGEGNPDENESVTRLNIKTDEGASFKMEYIDLIKTNENRADREAELGFKAEFDKIVEFVDNNGNGVYDSGEEVSEYDLGGENPIKVARKTVKKQGVTTHIVTISTKDGVFKATLFQSGTPIRVSGENITPNMAKITIEIENFPYESSNSKLALRTNVESEMGTEAEKEGDNINMTSGNYGGFFTWKDTAIVDGQRQPVKSTDLSKENEQGSRELYLIYGHGDSITHDPKIGVMGMVSSVSGALNWMIVIVAGLVTALVSMGITGLVKSRIY